MDVAAFEAERPRLFSLAYRLLGSGADADDVLQDAWLRVQGRDDVRDAAALLTTVVTRLCLDVLGSARVRREQYVGPWLPEPVPSAELGPLETAEQREQVTLAALVLLEHLTPVERAVTVLRDAFGYPYAEIAAVVEKSEAACRQVHVRARERLDAERPPRFSADPQRGVELGARLFEAAYAGDVAALAEALAEDVVLVSDGGGKAQAARRPVVGRDHVARFLVGVAAKGGPGVTASVADVNGAPAFLLQQDGVVGSVVAVTADGDVVRRIDVVVNPDKLSRVTSEGAASSEG